MYGPPKDTGLGQRTRRTYRSQRGKRLHIVVTSRPEPDIGEVFGALVQHSVDVGETTANQDITTYLEHQMKLQFQQYDEDTRKKIENSLTEGAEGS